MGKYFGTDGVRGRANEGLTWMVLWKRKTCQDPDW